MSDMMVKERITNLENLVAQSSRNVAQLSQEMRKFREDMRASREQFEADMRALRMDLNKKWGELANKMGTIAEDLVAPSVPRILRQAIGRPNGRIESTAVRVKRLHPADPARSQEFDVVAVSGEYVLINETKSSLDSQAVRDFARLMPQAREFFPEYADKKFIGTIASLYVDESVVKYGEKLGLIVLGFGEDVMEVLNSPGFKPKEF